MNLDDSKIFDLLVDVTGRLVYSSTVVLSIFVGINFYGFCQMQFQGCNFKDSYISGIAFFGGHCHGCNIHWWIFDFVDKLNNEIHENLYSTNIDKTIVLVYTLFFVLQFFSCTKNMIMITNFCCFPMPNCCWYTFNIFLIFATFKEE